MTDFLQLIPGLLLLLLGVLTYFLPALIAGWRGHPQRWAIFWLTFLAGWTFLGWVAALVWAVCHIQPRHNDAGRRTISARRCDYCNAPSATTVCPGCQEQIAHYEAAQARALLDHTTTTGESL